MSKEKYWKKININNYSKFHDSWFHEILPKKVLKDIKLNKKAPTPNKKLPCLIDMWSIFDWVSKRCFVLFLAFICWIECEQKFHKPKLALIVG